MRNFPIIAKQTRQIRGTMEHSQYKYFVNSFDTWLPNNYKLEYLSTTDEKAEIKRCLRELDTYKLFIVDDKDCKIPICGLCRDGYFIICGKPYVWTWSEVYCPNWIYKLKDSVVSWCSPITKPWELYIGRLKLSVHKSTICVEGHYDKGRVSLRQFLDANEMSDLTIYLRSSNCDINKYITLLNGQWDSKIYSLSGHPILPQLNTKIQKEKYLCLMLLNLLDDDVPLSDVNDISTKRLIGVNWLIGDVCNKLDTKVYNYMLKRIHTHGQLVDLSSAFEVISHISRVIRGKPGYGNDSTRELHTSHRGVYCPYRINEGEKIGLVVDLVTDVKITKYNRGVETISNDIINGCIPDSELMNYSCESKRWTWNDGGRVIPGNLNSIGFVAQQLVYVRHMPPVRAMYATTHVRQVVKHQYPQKPVIFSKLSNETIINGCNVLVAVSGYYGWNIEDAIVCSKSFIERGGLCSIEETVVRNSVGKKDIWLEDVYDVGKKIWEKDTILMYKDADNKTQSVRGVSGRVKSSISVNDDKTRILRLETMHKVELGDKLSSRSGQKGVIGHIPAVTELPCTKDGIVPDIIINPAHLPSRMTVSQMLESFFGKEALIDGKRIGDNEMKQKITSHSGKEEFVCGITGKKLENPLFFGSVYYMALRHKVHKKCRSRNIGGVVKLTGQPTKGGKLNGGLRIGEMERDALRSRDAEYILQDRLCKSSDRMSVKVCKSCGWLEPNKICCVKNDWIQIQMPRTTRLFLMELYAMGIFPKLHM